ncbi:PAS domain-containing protein [Acetobacteraceae bacterium KSS8]|uniref:histidine kinase n=1 Tax=Endosaccharibacter trunci TaxID=2812733 RepID=A0ABT1W565_9PROT|nr:PAS domain-containing protein [Acetobacteraceae bacterium KSS8]
MTRKKNTVATSRERSGDAATSAARSGIIRNAGLSGHGDVFFAAMQLSRMAMCLTDPNLPDEPIVFCNQAFEELTGYTAAEVVGRNCRFLQGAGTDRAAVSSIGPRLRAGQDVRIEVMNYRKDGSAFWNELSISEIRDDSGAIRYHFASQTDVTRRREAETVLRQSQRMEALGGMAASVAHEFNNLMTIVLANLERAAEGEDAERRRRQIQRASWGAERAARLTGQMLRFARRQFHESEVMDVNRTIADCDVILDQMAGEAVAVHLALADEPLFANLDASQLELVLLNLVRNAADASEPGQAVHISTGLVRQDGQEAVEIAVQDEGSGMPALVLRRATEAFFTTKGPGKGTGLGLSMVRSFAEQCGGRLLIESQEGEGTTVRLRFPRQTPPALSVDPEATLPA